MTKFKLKIASRRSKLAMVQTLWVKEQLEKNIPELEVSIEAMATQGDKILDAGLRLSVRCQEKQKFFTWAGDFNTLIETINNKILSLDCLLYTSPSPRD